MHKFLFKRFLIVIPQLILLSFVVFFLADLVATSTWISSEGSGLVDVTTHTSQRSGSFLFRYWNWVFYLVTTGDLGWSWRLGTSVNSLIAWRLTNTLRLSLFTLLIIYGLGIPLGILSGKNSGSWKDQLVQIVAQIGSSFPSFALGLLLLLILSFGLGWLPSSGSLPPGMTRDVGFWVYYVSRLRHLIIPGLAMGLVQLVIPMQYLRNEIIDTEQEEFVALARAKGATENHVFRNHILKNSINALLGSVPMQVATVITSSIIIESLFNFPGMGELFISAFAANDSHVIYGLILVFGVIILLGALICDLLTMSVDPRIKIEQ